MKNILLLILCFGFVQVMGQNLTFEIDVVDDNGSDPTVATSTVFVYVTNIPGPTENIGSSGTSIYYNSAETTPGVPDYSPLTNLGWNISGATNQGSVPASAPASAGGITIDSRYDVGIADFNFAGTNINQGQRILLFTIPFDNTPGTATGVDAGGTIHLGDASDNGSLAYTDGTFALNFPVSVSGNRSQALPITVSQFTAEKLSERSAKLFWETTSEINSDYFIVQRSTDTDNWESLGRVEATGTPTSTQSYEFVDNTIPSTLRSDDNIFFYRLAMVDLDEQYELSEIRTLSFKGNSGVINVYPNPTAQNIIVDLTSIEGQSKIQLIDIQGRLIFEQKVTDEHNDIPVLNLRDMGLDNGTYLVRITDYSTSQVHTKKILFID